MAYEEDGDQPELNLRKFNWEAFKPDRVVMLVGKRGTGKSVLLRDLLSHLSVEYDAGVAMSPTPESQDMFREFMPDSCVFDEYSSEKIGEIVTKLRQFNHMGVYKRVFVLLDDCMFDASVLKSKQMRDIHMNGRHLKILFLNIVQYVMDVPKAIRSQIDYVFALREPQRAYRENLYKNFFGIFPTYEEFSAAFDACTENFGCIVVDSTARTNAIEDSVFWYRGSPNPPKFILGNRNFWKLHYMFYKAPVHALSDDDIIPALAHKYKASKPTEEPPADKEKERPRKSGKKRRRDAIVVKKRDVDGAIIIEDAPPVAAPPPPVTSTEAPSAGAPTPSGPIVPGGPMRPPAGGAPPSHHHGPPPPPSSHAPLPPPFDRRPPPPAVSGSMAGPPATGARPPPIAGSLPPRQNTPRPPFEFGPPRPPSAIMATAMRAPAPRPFPQ
ncbi:hypothetical protein pqer_cds_276 [Pandoravirus quercus]|uniref:Uncharacterized protein n=2 Tax=Pandoravirus TaxID=2060084 RepID=A0A2U7U8C2_9VIRU|nr:hypothetical protein pqer_cds_276 [Pandoravirus quercus]AVK74698.1 hypothetical protein pqer_cds_276 [Pandoravirus quercus]QBZ80875.1 Epstein-Barr virus nuclear antigen 3 incomplete domain containing protein [Pandoravirus celtis]